MKKSNFIVWLLLYNILVIKATAPLFGVYDAETGGVDQPAPEPTLTTNAISVYGNVDGKTDQSATWSGFVEPDSAVNGNHYKTISNLETPATIVFTSLLNVQGSTNSLHLDLFAYSNLTSVEITLIDTVGHSRTYLVPKEKLNPGQWVRIDVWLSIFQMGGSNPVDPSRLKTIQFTGEGAVSIDNIYFHQRTSNTLPIVWVRNANGLSGQSLFHSLSEAFDLIAEFDQSEREIEVGILGNSTEREEIVVRAPLGMWDKLDIYPASFGTGTEAKTITFQPAYPETKDPLFNFYHVQHVTLSGKMVSWTGTRENPGEISARDGDDQSLTIRGANTGIAHADASIHLISEIEDKACDHIVIENCIFEGSDATAPPGQFNRPANTIAGSGINVTIRNNTFRNSLYTTGEPDLTLSVIYTGNDEEEGALPSDKWTISGNSFYENTRLAFDFPTVRHFIALQSSMPTASFVIENNYIGGENGVGDGVMYLGSAWGGTPAEGEVSTSLLPIAVWLEPVAEGAPVDTTVIRGNTIAHIDLTCPTDSVYRHGEKKSGFAAFCGIRTENGHVLVVNNEVSNIVYRSVAATPNAGSDRADLIHTAAGISCEAQGRDDGGVSLSSFVCDSNAVDEIRIKILPKPGESGTGSLLKSFAIEGLAGRHAAGTIRNNRVVWGYNDTTRIADGSNIGGIEASVTGGQGAKIEAYNNIAALTEYNYPYSIRAKSIQVADNDGEQPDGLGVYCYNNIACVLPGSYHAPEAILGGLAAVSDNLGVDNARHNKMNVFHNTVAVFDTGQEGLEGFSSAAFIYQTGENGSIDVWNNVFVNFDPKGVAVWRETAGSGQQPPSETVRIDYNQYYSRSAAVAFVDEGTGYAIATFDDWKFNNRWAGDEQDFHSRFADPEFAESTPVDPTDLDGLRAQLQPARFLGGRKTENAILAATAWGNDAGNTDFSPTPTVRRPYLPTMGAIRTSFSNFWTGAIDNDWNRAENWSDGFVPAPDDDIVFAPTPANPLVAGNDTTLRDLYNDTPMWLDVNGHRLTIAGYVGQERPEGVEYADYAKIDASAAGSKIEYNGQTGGNPQGGAAQHIFRHTFVENKVDELIMHNQSDYFVLLHGGATEGADLEITNRLTNLNSDVRTANGRHIGGLNCIGYPTTLIFSNPADDQRIPANVIFNDSAYNLVVNSQKLITEHDSLFIANDLTIRQADKGVFEIAADKFVKVDGLTTNNGGEEGLIVKSDETKPSASFLFNNGENDPAVAATVEFYSRAYKGDDGKYKWQFFTPPVKTTKPVVDVFLNAWVRRWAAHPVNRNPYYGTPYWIYLENSHPLTSEGYEEGQGKGAFYAYAGYDPAGAPNNGNANPQPVASYPMQGYEITQDTPTTYSVAGELTNDNYTLPLTYAVYDEEKTSYGSFDWSAGDEPQLAMNGQYVVGNPYAASIKISELEFSDKMDKTVYIFNTGSYQDWKNNSPLRTFGQYIVVPKETAGRAEGLPSEIPSMQGFVVMFDSAQSPEVGTTATFGLQYAATRGKNPYPLRSSSGELAHTLVDLSSDGVDEDRLWLFVEPSCKKGFDNGWDGRKFVDPSASAPAQVFMMEGADRYQVSTMDDLDGVYLGIKTGSPDKEYALAFTHSGGEGKRWLTDLEEGRVVDVSESGSSYAFRVEKAGEIQKRFLLTTSAVYSSSDETAVDPLRDKQAVHTEGTTIVVENTKQADGWLTVYDAAGKQVAREKAPAKQTTRIPTSLEAGVYPALFVAGNQRHSYKLIIF